MSERTPSPNFATSNLYTDYDRQPLANLVVELSCLDAGDRAEFYRMLTQWIRERPSYDEARVQADLDDPDHVPPARPRQPNVVYYLRFGDRVKIGTTTHLANRLRALPFDEVLAVEPGGSDVERRRHAQFADLRVTGEWFEYKARLREHIASLG